MWKLLWFTHQMADHTKAYIGLGGNVGDVFGNMEAALQLLHSHQQVSVSAISKVYKTPPWGIEDQDWFLNACAELETSMSAQSLLHMCLETEKSLKRVRDIRWGPRTIDLDVLVFGNEEINQDNLQVPHPRMHERAFVLKPMADIAPSLQFHGKTIEQWLNECGADEIEETDLELNL